MKIWEKQAECPGVNCGTAQFSVFADGAASRVCIRAVDRVADERAVIVMTADQAEAFARDLLDATLPLQGARSGWRIIADDPPPDDGRDLLLFQAGWGIRPVIVGRTHDDTWVSDCFDIDAPDQRPTHWMPLPDEPQVERTND